MSDIPNGLVHRPDHDTSERAARNVLRKRVTIRWRVEEFAKKHPEGFIDEDLWRLDPDAPESSFRKRRTELSDQNIIVDSGLRRPNVKNQECIVWMHRRHVTNPPPLKKREKKPSRFDALRDENARLRAEIDQAADRERDRVISFIQLYSDDPEAPEMLHTVERAIRRGDHRES